MIVLDDAHFKFLVLSILLSRLERGDIEALRCAGLDDRQMEALRRLSASDLVRLCGLKTLQIAIHVDGASLDRSIHVAMELREEMELIEWFVHRNASTAMLEDLFGADPDAVERLRICLCDSPRPGRPTLPPPGVRDSIHAVWHEIRRSGLDDPHAFQALGERFQEYDMQSLYAVINEFGD